MAGTRARAGASIVLGRRSGVRSAAIRYRAEVGAAGTEVPSRRDRSPAMKIAPILRALRPHQWAKNLLIATPLLLAHQTHDRHKLLSVLIAMVCFSLCASAVYVTNDYFDIAEDREHPTKRRRPFAAGELPLRLAPFLAVALLVIGFIAADL